jgi:hypothetical protein
VTDERDKANAPAEAAAPGFKQWAASHGYMTEEWWSLNGATQLLRHGFMQEVRALAFGAMPGVEGQVQFALADFAEEGRSGLEAHWFTVALMPMPKSLGFATRILCHDRGLTESERSNPDAERQIVELDDQAVRLESDAFLARYTLSADHDQDNMRTWELFDPALVQWLTADAPAGFSFELQDGALCCFIKGPVGDPAKLDELAAASARVAARVNELIAGIDSPGVAPAPVVTAGTRTEIVRDELAEHGFAEPPDSVRDAAKAFRKGPFISGQAWKLGAEAFFRAYARTIGFEPIELSAFKAANQDATIPGVLSQIAHGKLPGSEIDGYLALSSGDDETDWGFMTLLATALPGVNNYAFARDAEAQAMEKDGFDWSGDRSRIYVWKTDGHAPRHRKRKDIDAFVGKASPVLVRLVQGG